jgi:hypothetical protein
MQVPVTTIDAWDWSQNVIDGAAVFYSKLSTAARIGKKIIAQTPGLPPLTAVQLENMALVLYGEFGSKNLTKQYYIADTSGPSPVWIVNTANNPDGVAYADKCRANVR